jgi:hypothetical protein
MNRRHSSQLFLTIQTTIADFRPRAEPDSFRFRAEIATEVDPNSSWTREQGVDGVRRIRLPRADGLYPAAE